MEGYKKRNDMLFKKLKRAHDLLQEKLGEAEKEVKDQAKEVKRLAKEGKDKDKELSAQATTIEHLRKALAMADSETKKLAEIQALNGVVAAKDDELEQLRADLEALDHEHVDAQNAFNVELAREQDRSRRREGRVAAWWRWQWAMAAVLLGERTKLEKRAKTRAMVVQFLMGKDGDEKALHLDSMTFELSTTREMLEEVHEERESVLDQPHSTASFHS